MLKSELVISEDLELLNSHLKHYSIRFLGHVFLNEGGAGIEGYKKERTRLITAIKLNNQTARNLIIPQMLSERELFVKVKELILRNKEWDIDPLIIKNILEQMEAVSAAIDKCCIETLTNDLLSAYYDESLVLLVYFGIIRSYIITIKKLYDKFKQNSIACVLKFSHKAETSLSITQQKDIIAFIEMILACFFVDYLDIFTVEFDTGSPKMEVAIKLNLEVKVTLDITKLFSDLFRYIIAQNMPDSIRALKKISNQLKKNQKDDIEQLKSIKEEIPQDEYEKRLLAIYDYGNELRKKQIEVAVDDTNVNKRLEGKTPLLIEDSSETPPETP